MRKSDLKGCIEASKGCTDLKGCTNLICSVQEQSIRTNYIKNNIGKTGKSPLCRICGARNETISHIVSECGKLGRYVHWQFCEKLGFKRARLWYEHEPESVGKNKNFKILWAFTI